MMDEQLQFFARSLAALVKRAGGEVRIPLDEMTGDPPVACIKTLEGDDVAIRLLDPADPFQVLAAGAIMQAAADREAAR